MTDRLQAALKELDPEALEQITQLAEFLAERRATAVGGQKPLNLSWVGCLRDAPERSGVEAAETANRMRIESIERSMPK